MKANPREHIIVYQSEVREDTDQKCPMGTAKQWPQKSLQETGGATPISAWCEAANSGVNTLGANVGG